MEGAVRCGQGPLITNNLTQPNKEEKQIMAVSIISDFGTLTRTPRVFHSSSKKPHSIDSHDTEGEWIV